MSVFASAERTLITKKKSGYTNEGESLHGMKAKISYRVDDQRLQGLSKLGFVDPKSLIWELLPYSFVVDYFTGFGKYLENLTASLGLTFIGGYKTSYVKESGKITLPLTSNEFGSPPSWKWSNFEFARAPYGAFPVSKIRLQLPSLNQSAVIIGLVILRS
jgi:hypothetical protein